MSLNFEFVVVSIFHLDSGGGGRIKLLGWDAIFVDLHVHLIWLENFAHNWVELHLYIVEPYSPNIEEVQAIDSRLQKNQFNPLLWDLYKFFKR